ncbi:MAG: glycosyl hydrolase family 18 protein, partial [Candidatus Acidiferrales bacterium]
MPERKPIFYDQERRRWRRTRRVLEITGGIFTLLLIIFLVNVFRNPDLPDLLHPDIHAGLHAIHSRQKPRPLRLGRKRRVAALGKVPQNYDPLRAAFYVSWDATSLASLQQHYKDIDLLIPSSLHATSPDGRLDVEQDSKLVGWLRTSGIEMPVMSMVNNYDGKDWVVQEMAEMLSRPESRHRLSKELTNFALEQHEPGIVVDFELIPETSQDDFSHFIHDLGAALHASGLKLMVALPAADWSYDYKYLASQSDALILMNYDMHWPTSPPGPIVPQDWFVRNIQNILKIVPADKILMGIANYGYDWPAKTKTD